MPSDAFLAIAGNSDLLFVFLRASDELNELSATPRGAWNHPERRSSVGTDLGGPASGLGSGNVLN
jgi:hypothetical protein